MRRMFDCKTTRVIGAECSTGAQEDGPAPTSATVASRSSRMAPQRAIYYSDPDPAD